MLDTLRLASLIRSSVIEVTREHLAQRMHTEAETGADPAFWYERVADVERSVATPAICQSELHADSAVTSPEIVKRNNFLTSSPNARAVAAFEFECMPMS